MPFASSRKTAPGRHGDSKAEATTSERKWKSISYVKLRRISPMAKSRCSSRSGSKRRGTAPATPSPSTTRAASSSRTSTRSTTRRLAPSGSSHRPRNTESAGTCDTGGCHKFRRVENPFKINDVSTVTGFEHSARKQVEEQKQG